MTLEALTAWVLSWMIHLLAPALAHNPCEACKKTHHWETSYPETARAIAEVSLESPLFKGEDGPKRTAAVLVAWAMFESRFDPHAVGDNGKALGMFQVHASTVPATPQENLFDPLEAARTARELLRRSSRICRKFDVLELGGWYAAGGEGCQEAGRKKSRHRMSLAMRLLKETP
jgi:transglycosylase-like protein with SLT domain